MDTPFFDRIRSLSAQDAWFHVPGHKGNPAALPPLAAALPFDLTEIEGADDLQHPTGVLAQSEANMTKAFGFGASLYTTFGCSCAIKAMLTLYVRTGQKVLMTRGSHVSAIRALAFLGAEPLFLYPDEENGISLSELELQLQKHSDIGAVYITSPDYHGFLADIAAIAEIAHRHGVPLLVDNAHGAHLRFCTPDRHPLRLSADASADSIHKTMPCLTGAALLQLRDASLKEQARWALNFQGGTSPSYLTLCSMDLCAGMLLQNPPDYDKTAARITELADKFPRLILQSPRHDPCKVTLCAAAAGYRAEELADILSAAGIYPEFTGERYVVLMANPYNTEEAFARLEKVLVTLEKRPPLICGGQLPHPRKVCSLRAAVLAEHETLPLEKAIGRVAARVLTPCPPGVPAVMPGEMVDKASAELLRKSGILKIDVVK